MREASDLVRIRVTTVRELTFDLEQLEVNPRFRSILDTLQSSSLEPPSISRAIEEYVLHYIGTDSFPYRTPGTTGPGNIHHVNVEVPSESDQHQEPRGADEAGRDTAA